jgi:hypothetical protein
VGCLQSRRRVRRRGSGGTCGDGGGWLTTDAVRAEAGAAGAVIIDRRSCPSAPSCLGRGFDGGKKIKSIKIHLAVDKHGFPLAINVSLENMHDSKSIVPVLHQLASIPEGIRWVVERSLAWVSRHRRLNTIFERTKEHPIASIEIAFLSILSRRLVRLVTEEISD